VRLALMIEGQEGVTWNDWLAIARACEESGVETLVRSDHYSGFHGGKAGSLDAWATLSALAAETQTLRLGTLVSPATFRHPSVLARMVVTADHVSGGRISLGMGAGWHDVEHEQFGFPFHNRSWRLEVFREQLEIVHRQLNEDEPFDFHGKHYTLVGCDAQPKPVQRPLPILVGGAAKRGTAEPGARFASEYNTTSASPEECRRRRAALDGFCEAAGRDPATLPLSLMTSCIVGRDRAELDDRRRLLAERLGRPIDDGESSRRALSGTVDEVAEQLREFEAAGVTRVMCQHLLHDDLDMIALLGREVAPAVA
jgi:alkanesulfonate monooxygenase SsuD/methylene tetrahydromethanopterin reductase-like flavin-dependent oxidoreductase (luciferase family)